MSRSCQSRSCCLLDVLEIVIDSVMDPTFHMTMSHSSDTLLCRLDLLGKGQSRDHVPSFGGSVSTQFLSSAMWSVCNVHSGCGHLCLSPCLSVVGHSSKKVIAVSSSSGSHDVIGSTCLPHGDFGWSMCRSFCCLSKECAKSTCL